MSENWKDAWFLVNNVAGHDVYEVIGCDPAIGQEGKQFFFYQDTKEPCDIFNPRPCKKCGKGKTEKGHDACIADLPGVEFACCGHGNSNNTPYIKFTNGVVWEGGGVREKLGE